jgi:hypothetical protein
MIWGKNFTMVPIYMQDEVKGQGISFANTTVTLSVNHIANRHNMLKVSGQFT